MLLPSGVDPADVVVKISASAHQNSEIHHEAAMYTECQRGGITGTAGVVPELYEHGKLEDFRAYILLQNSPGCRWRLSGRMK